MGHSRRSFSNVNGTHTGISLTLFRDIMADNSPTPAPAALPIPFRDDFELTDAMAKPEYRLSPAYRADVEARIEATPWLRANAHSTNTPMWNATSVKGAQEGEQTNESIRQQILGTRGQLGTLDQQPFVQLAAKQEGGKQEDAGNLEDFIRLAAERNAGRRNF